MFLLLLISLAHGTCSSRLHANDNQPRQILLRTHMPFAWSNDGRYLVHWTARGWHVKGTLSRDAGMLLGAGESLRPIAISCTASHFLFRRDNGDYELQTSAGRRRMQLPGHHRVIFSNSGRSVVQVDPWQGQVKIYDLGSGDMFSRFRLDVEANPRHAIWGAQYDDYMNRLLIKYTGEDAPAWIEPLGEGYAFRRAYQPPPGFGSHRPNTGDPVHDFLATERYLEASAVSEFGRYAVFARGIGLAGTQGFEVNLDAYAAVTGSRLGHAVLHAKPTAIAFSVDERQVAVATEAPTRIHVYTLSQLGAPVRTIAFGEGGPIEHLAFIGGRVVAFAPEAGLVVAF